MLQLLKFMKPYRKECVLAPLFKMLEAFFELFVPLVVADIIDRGIKGGTSSYIIRGAILMTLLAIVGLCSSITAQYFSAKAAVGFATKLRSKLFRHMQGFSYTETDRMGASTMINRLTSDVNQVQSGVNLTLRLLLRSPFIVFGAMIMAFTIDVDSAIIFTIMIPLLSIVVFGIMLISIPLFKKVQRRLDQVLGVTRENLTGVRVIRAFGREADETEHFDRASESHATLQRFVGGLSALMNPVTYVIVNASVIVLLHVGAIRINDGIITQGELVALYNYMTQILVELVKLASLIISITKAVACGNRIGKVLEIPNESDYQKEVDLESASWDVTFSDVSFRYDGSAENALSHLSFSVKEGSVLGIIGGTGSGKSTLVNLIPRFYDATEGAITVAGYPISEIPRKQLRSLIGVVPQKAALFRGTVRSNLLFGNEDASDETLHEALKASEALDFVMRMEGGLDAEIEQNGKNLSGGQKQRLTIARALVRKPRILILDDSASALDYATDARLRRSIAALPYHPTVLVISQRTATLSSADHILVLEDGEAVGFGTHEELLKTSPIYAEIHESQFGKEEA